MLDEASKITQWYKDRETDFRERFDRMDESYKLWDLVKTKVAEGSGTTINITLPDPRKVADWISGKLSAAEMQIIIRMAEAEGEDKREDIAKLERLFPFLFDMADRRLKGMLLPTLREYFSWSAPMRGWLAARVLMRVGKQGIISDIVALDPRWLVYDTGESGVVRSGYKTFRSKQELKSQYDFEPVSGDENKALEVVEALEFLEPGKVAYSLVCNSEYVFKKTQILKLKSMPVIIKPVAQRPPISGEIGNEFARYGDDIFAPMRELYPIKNKLVSMWASHANKLGESPLINYYSGAGSTDITDAFNTAGGMINLPKGQNEITEVPMKEISVTLINMVQLIEKELQEAGVPSVVYGQMEGGPWSGTSLGVLREASNKVLGPQIRTFNAFYSSICELIEEQLMDSKQNVLIKAELEKKYYEAKVTPVDLKKPHITRVEFTATTPWEQLDSYQIADMAQALDLPLEFIHEYILKLQDPKGLGIQKAVEVAEHMPEFMMLRAIKGFIDKGQTDEARRLMQIMAQQAMAEQSGLEQEIAGPQQAPPGAV